MMPKETINKIVRQYNKEPISPEDMQKLQEIASDCRTVKNYVYQRYGGIKSLSKLYPGYTVQNEMTTCGLREHLSLPSVYFYLAVFDALRDIKSQWSRIKAAVLKRIQANEALTEEEKHLARYLLKVSNAFEAVLNCTPMKLPKAFEQQYQILSEGVNVKKVENYLRRQVRKRQVKLHTDAADGFAVSERAYRYGDHGIYLSVKEKRKRIYIPLTDTNQYTRQLYVQLYPDRGDIELKVLIDVSVKKCPDYTRRIGLSMGMYTMLVTEEGHMYGEALGDYQEQLSNWLREEHTKYRKNRAANPGRKKYEAKKQRLEEQLHTYINQELNHFLKTEKPAVLYLPKLPRPGVTGPVKRINYLVTTWQRGYIRRRLIQKCQEQSIAFIEVFGKNISKECSQCGENGTIKGEDFSCPSCGYKTKKKTNAAQNAKKRGEANHKDRNPG